MTLSSSSGAADSPVVAAASAQPPASLLLLIGWHLQSRQQRCCKHQWLWLVSVQACSLCSCLLTVLLVTVMAQVAALAARKAAAASAEAHASDDKVNGENDLQRLDTTAKLEIAAQKEQNWFRRTAIQVCCDVSTQTSLAVLQHNVAHSDIPTTQPVPKAPLASHLSTASKLNSERTGRMQTTDFSVEASHEINHWLCIA